MRRKIKKRHGNSVFKDSVKRKVVEALLLGSTYAIAAAFAGIAESTLFRWLATGREQNEGEYHDFMRACKEAEAQFALRNLSVMSAAANNGSWQASAWLLERRCNYSAKAESNPIDITVEISSSDVPALIEQIREEALQDIVLGPVIDLDEQ